MPPHDVYIANYLDVRGWGGAGTAADGLADACRQRRLSTLTIGVSADNGAPVHVSPETTCLNVPVRLPAGLWRVHGLAVPHLLRRHLRRLGPPGVAFVAASPFWAVAAKRAWPDVPVIYRLPCVLANCLPFTWPGRRSPTAWARAQFAVIRRIEHRAIALADQTLVATPEVAEEVVAFHPAARDRVSPAYYGFRRPAVSEQLRHRQRDELGLDGDAFVIAAIGVCDLNKGFDWAIRELAAVDPRGKLMIVGDGPQLGALESLAAQSNVAERVHFAGAQRDMAPWFAAADCVISTSFYDACPNVIREAMSCGRSVVVPRHDPPQVYAGIAGTIRREGGGLLYDRQEPGALAACLNRLIGDDELAATVGRTARAVAPRMFDWEACVEHVLACRRYQESLCPH